MYYPPPPDECNNVYYATLKKITQFISIDNNFLVPVSLNFKISILGNIQALPGQYSKMGMTFGVNNYHFHVIHSY